MSAAFCVCGGHEAAAEHGAPGVHPFTVATSIKPPYCTENGSGALDLVLKELMRRVEQPYRIARLPAERSLWMLNQGEADADLPRIGGLNASYPNIIQVPEPIMQYRFTAFTREGGPVITAWEDLRHLRVACIRGWKVFEQHIGGMPHALTVSGNDSLFAMLREGRVDVVLHERCLGSHAAREAGVDVVMSPRPLTVQNMYIYVNNRHTLLARRMVDALKDMHAEGLLNMSPEDTQR